MCLAEAVLLQIVNNIVGEVREQTVELQFLEGAVENSVRVLEALEGLVHAVGPAVHLHAVLTGEFGHVVDLVVKMMSGRL